MAKPTGAQVAAQALQYAQEKRSYQEMDCQAMIEAAVRACGGKMDYAGSNAMARAVTGLMPLSEAKKAGLQVGMALFIHEDGGQLSGEVSRGRSRQFQPRWALCG